MPVPSIEDREGTGHAQGAVGMRAVRHMPIRQLLFVRDFAHISSGPEERVCVLREGAADRRERSEDGLRDEEAQSAHQRD